MNKNIYLNSAGASECVINKNNVENSIQDKERRKEELGKACADFESMFVFQLLQTMRKTIPKGGLFSDTSSWGSTYMLMFDQKVAEDLANRGGGIGLQKVLFQQLAKSLKLTGKD